MAFACTLRFQRTRAQFPILCAARDGSNSIWTYEIERVADAGAQTWQVRARPVDDEYDGVDWYELTLTEVDRETVQITFVGNHLDGRFHGRGVAPVLYPEVARQLGRRLISSRSAVEDSVKCRSPKATAIWNYLVARGHAQPVTGTDTFVIDGRSGVAAPPNREALPSGRRAMPTTETEFQQLMEEVDASLRQQGIPITGRTLAGGAQISGLLGVTMYPHLDAGEPLSGVYEGVDLPIRIRRWFDARYGDKQKVNFSPGRTVVHLRGDAWLMELPWMVGRHVLFASRTEVSDSGEMRQDLGPPSRYNVLDAIGELPPGLRAVLSDDDLRMCVEIFERAMGAYRAMHDCDGQTFVREALADHTACVEHLTGPNVHPGQARWSALQATEKMYKSFLVAVDRPVPTGKGGHDLRLLSSEAAKAGLDPADAFYLDAIQCSPSVRYGQAPSTLGEAIAAHQAALELSWYVGDEVRRVKGVRRRAV